MNSPAAGRFVVIIGPDGVGKTSLARSLLGEWSGDAYYFHFRPPIRPSLRVSTPEPGQFISRKPNTSGSVIGGWARLMRNVVMFWAGYLLRVRPALKSGDLVVGDRWAYGYIAQPHALKFHGPGWLARLAVNALPQPDLVVRLTAPPELVISRKAELSIAQIIDEDAKWATVAHANMLTLESTLPAAVLARVVLRQL